MMVTWALFSCQGDIWNLAKQNEHITDHLNGGAVFVLLLIGGRGWIRTSSTITIHWMRFEIVMDSCAFFEFYQKSNIGYHNHLGTKTGYKVGYFARGEYSASASETAIAAVSALPSTA